MRSARGVKSRRRLGTPWRTRMRNNSRAEIGKTLMVKMTPTASNVRYRSRKVTTLLNVTAARNGSTVDVANVT